MGGRYSSPQAIDNMLTEVDRRLQRVEWITNTIDGFTNANGTGLIATGTMPGPVLTPIFLPAPIRVLGLSTYGNSSAGSSSFTFAIYRAKRVELPRPTARVSATAIGTAPSTTSIEWTKIVSSGVVTYASASIARIGCVFDKEYLLEPANNLYAIAVQTSGANAQIYGAAISGQNIYYDGGVSTFGQFPSTIRASSVTSSGYTYVFTVASAFGLPLLGLT